MTTNLPGEFAALIASPTTSRLHPFDLALIVVYLLGITLFGLRFRKSSATGADGKPDKSLKNYFLANNTVPWWAIALSIVSAETSTLTIISVPGVAFAGDFGFLQIVLGYLLGRVVVALIFLPRYFQGRMLTAYQLIDQRFGPTLHKVTAGLFLLTRAAAEGVRVFAISIVVGIAIGTDDTLSIAIISILTLLYTFEGGMAAVIWTDVVQMAIYIGGTLVAIFTLGNHIPGGWSQIHEVAGAAGKFHLFNFAFNLTQSYTFWAGLLGGTFLTMASHGTDQLMVQRMLAARNLGESRLALLSSGLIILLQFTLFLLIGAGLFVFYGLHPQSFSSADRIFPTFIVQQMPIGIAGLLIAAILAAAMSNLSAALNSLSSTTVVDFYMHLRPQADDRERMLISRASTVWWAIVLFAIAVYSVHSGGKGHVVETGLSIASVAYGCLLGVFLLGTLTRFATQWGSIIGMVCGFALNLALWLQPKAIVFNSGLTFTTPTKTAYLLDRIPKVAFTWYVLIGAIVTFVVGSLASLIFRKQSTRKAVTVAAFLFCLSLGHYAVGQATPNFASIDTLVNEAIAAHKLPGAVVLVGHNDQIVFHRAYGSRKLAGEPDIYGKPSPAEPMIEETIFDMASLSKCLSTATAIMQLYEAGKLQFDDPVAKYLPEFAVNGKEKVTIRELLTHYSGLPEDVDLKDPWGLAAPNKAEGIRRAMNSTLYGPPGLTFKYSDINFITLGALVEKISGTTLSSYAQMEIFLPLHMTDTAYYPADRICGTNHLLGAAVVMNPPRTDGLGSVWDCLGDSWVADLMIPRTAPTAHDNEGTPATNPDYDHLLRAVVHDPTTRRMGGVAGHAGVFSTAHDVGLYAQALLDKLLFNTGPFPLKQSTLKLMTTPEQPATAQSGATVFTPDGQPSKGIATRGFGWDINTAFSRPRGSIFPIGSFGHTGFTGTTLWMDPASNSYVVLLANAIHPRGGAPISPLRGQVATAAAQALGLPTLPQSSPEVVAARSVSGSTSTPTLTGIDVLESTHYAALTEVATHHQNHLALGVLTNQNGVDAHGHRTIDLLFTDASKAVPGLTLKTIFSPEHGISGTHDDLHLSNDTDPATLLPVISLYGGKESDRRPTHDSLKDLDAVVIDLQDAGVRFWTYEAAMGYFLEAAAAERDQYRHNLEIVILDRPNLVGGEKVQGPVSDPGLESYTDYMPLPIRHGLTFGELARYINGERRLPSPASPNVFAPLSVPLTVVRMEHWTRDQYFEDTHLPWINPSPNLKSPTAAILYPGVGMIEGTNVSVGRGTDTPFQHLGACWTPLKSAAKKAPLGPCAPEDQIDGAALAAYLTARHIPGVAFASTSFVVAEDSNHYPGHGQTIQGIALTTTDRNALDTPELGIELLSALHHLYPTRFNLGRAKTLVASVNTMQALSNNEDPHAIAASWAADLNDFKRRRQLYLLYP
ncbi:sodium/solute symporter [Granulicella sp. dw_53]|uniref:sodium:solute symporter family transporter n=1 Tax=Granulicella sp. dw_53 TaxID=2719792 RepID=UPI0021033303|nr:sodium/solute symporter [Granulicella sp. dw_53]